MYTLSVVDAASFVAPSCKLLNLLKTVNPATHMDLLHLAIKG